MWLDARRGHRVFAHTSVKISPFQQRSQLCDSMHKWSSLESDEALDNNLRCPRCRRIILVCRRRRANLESNHVASRNTFCPDQDRLASDAIVRRASDASARRTGTRLGAP